VVDVSSGLVSCTGEVVDLTEISVDDCSVFVGADGLSSPKQPVIVRMAVLPQRQRNFLRELLEDTSRNPEMWIYVFGRRSGPQQMDLEQ
jgi:hypothetical protein